MKKIIILVLVAILLCGAVSCGQKEPAETENTALTPAESSEGIADNTQSNDETEKDTAKAETTAVPEETEPENAPVETEAPQMDEKGYSCVFDDGTIIELGGAAEAVLGALGAPLNVAEAPSCIHEGTDRIYSFNGYSVTTSPDGKGTDRVHEVALTSDAVLLENGISIGSPLDAVTAAFGTDYSEQFGVLQYEKENVKISVVLDSDSCVSSLVFTAAE